MPRSSPLHEFFDVLCGQDEALFYAVQFCYSGNAEKALRELNWARAEEYVEFYRMKDGQKQVLKDWEVADLFRHSAVLPLSMEVQREIFLGLTEKGLKLQE